MVVRSILLHHQYSVNRVCIYSLFVFFFSFLSLLFSLQFFPQLFQTADPLPVPGVQVAALPPVGHYIHLPLNSPRFIISPRSRIVQGSNPRWCALYLRNVAGPYSGCSSYNIVLHRNKQLSERIARDMIILLCDYIVVLILVEHNNGTVLDPSETWVYHRPRPFFILLLVIQDWTHIVFYSPMFTRIHCYI